MPPFALSNNLLLLFYPNLIVSSFSPDGSVWMMSAAAEYLLNLYGDTLQMAPIPSAVAGPSNQSTGDKSGLVCQLRSKITEMERDLTTLHTGVAVVKKKGELAMVLETCGRDELVKATKSLQCE